MDWSTTLLGCYLTDLEAAHREAIESARYLTTESILKDGRIGLFRSMEAWDANGARLLVVPFYQAVTDLEETTVS